MRKNIKNDKVIRAMAIGISAMLATTSPMTALAAENTDVPADDDKNTSTATTEEGVCDEAQEAADSAAEAVETAEGSADTVKKDVAENVEVGEAGTDSKGNDLAQAVIEAADKIENAEKAEEAEAENSAEAEAENSAEAEAENSAEAEAENSAEAEAENSAEAEVENDAEAEAENSADAEAENGTTLADAKTAITNVDTQLEIAEANDELSDAALGKAEKAAEEAAGTAEEMKDAMQKAEQKVDDQIDQIKNATTAEEANTAYVELEATADAAEEDFNAKLEAYNTAKASYDEAAAKVAEYEKAYNDAIATAGANVTEAETALAEAKKNAEALEQAVAAAKEAVDASAKGAMAIADAEKETQEDNGLNWKNEDKLFIAIMEKYYLPEQCKISGAKVTRVQGKDNNEYNYFAAVYKDENGVEQTKYFNYKMDGDSKDKIVIFEKREVEVLGGYVGVKENNGKTEETGTELLQAELEEGVANGTIVKTTDETYVIKGEESTVDTLVKETEVTETSTNDVTIDESSQQESYQLDENGNLVKTVTADVTTITYTAASFTSNQEYATDAERDEAAAAKETELEDATGKDATVTETEETTYTYTASGTYIPTFTKTVTVNNAEVERKYSDSIFDEGVKTEGEAFKQIEKEQESKICEELEEESECDELYLLDVQSNLDVTGQTKNEWYDDSDFLVSGTVSATYAKVTKQTVDQSTFGSLWDDIKALVSGGQTTNQKLEEAARSVIEAAGGIFLSAEWADWSYDKATIRYVAGVKVTTDEKQTKEEAENAVADAALAQAKENGATGVYNVNTTGTDKIAHTTYSYKVDYLAKDTETTENKEIAKETYTSAEELTNQVTQNLNYINNIILLTQDNDDYREFVDSAKDLTSKYDRLLKEAEKADEDVATAQTKVETLKKEIEALKNREGNLDALKELETKLAAAEADKKAAEEAKDSILEKLEDAEDILEEVVKELTPSEEEGEGDNSGEDGTGEEDGNGGAADKDGAGEEGGNGGAADEDGTGEEDGNGGAADEDGAGEEGGNGGAADEDGTGEEDGNGEAADEEGTGEEGGNGDANGNEVTGGTGEATGADDVEDTGDVDDTEDADGDEDADDVATVLTTGDAVTAAATPVETPVQTIAAPAQTTATTTTTPENTVVIEEENTPLANTVKDQESTNAEEKVEAKNAEEEQEVVAIEDEKAPLANAVEKEKMSWWWWLLILLLGAAGYEMYKKHQEKKKAAEVEADKAE